MIYVSQRKPNKTLKNFFYNLSPKKEIKRVNTPQEAVDLLSKKVDSYVCVDLLTTNLDVQTLNALMENSDNLLLLGLHSMRQKKKVGIFSRGRANIALFDTVGTALQEAGLVKNAKLINLYKPQTTEITEDDITFDRSLQQDELEEINFIPLSSEDAAVAIMEQLPKLDLAILGLPYPMNTEHFLWHLVERIKNGNGGTDFILVRQRMQKPKQRPHRVETEDPTTVFVRNTFPKASFNKEWIRQRKNERKQRIAVVIPAFNEEETIAEVVQCYLPLKEEGILDRIIVIDNDSTDATFNIASKAGAEVFRSGEIHPELGAFRGKGEALWKSLFVLNNIDIVAFLDADIKNPTEDMVLGTIGPLVLRRDIQLVKGYFNRGGPEDKNLKSGGGRVTEILVRPLLSMEMPELLFLFQPLSGFTAARTSLLRSIPFYTGYGIEIGFLIHTAKKFGVSAIAQSDVGWIVHRNQRIEALTRMSTEVLQAFHDATETAQVETVELKTSLLYALLSSEKYSLLKRNITQLRRPPVNTLLKSLSSEPNKAYTDSPNASAPDNTRKDS
ncbi:glucosyl-3-phosphoglycerate synthase [Coprothermobacter proteolyticus]|uniref:glucosyl-3-phosphoglycerate synthase n=1 Tax=Coprothermobacter proteolyticus TaxID=35786 RepID=UPI000D30709B|nr:glucosyl-3-phosphoglycerate synthase [Coprothermobacter proteolyticus]